MCEITNNISLKKFNSFGIDVKTKYFTEFKSVLELEKIVESEIFKKNNKFILGGGSNLLFTKDYNGLIIRNNIKGIKIIDHNVSNTTIEVGSGENWHNFVMWSIEQNLSGIENLALIPGTVGASPIQNIGAYGVEVKDTIKKVYAFEIATKKLHVFNNNECKFSYRNSIFKQELKNKFIITKVEFKLSKKPMKKISYGDIKKELNDLNLNSLPKNIARAVINIRSRKLPKPEEIGNSGSFFKNPIINSSDFKKLQKKFPKIVGYKISENQTKIAAGWLIENIGLKGYRKGDAGVHKNQALVIVNYGNASGKDIINLARMIQTKIFETYDIKIHPEVTII